MVLFSVFHILFYILETKAEAAMSLSPYPFLTARKYLSNPALARSSCSSSFFAASKTISESFKALLTEKLVVYFFR